MNLRKIRKMKRKSGNIVIKNRKASHDYEFLEKFMAGIVLTGTEIKSIRLGKAALVDSYCFFRNNELFIKIGRASCRERV